MLKKKNIITISLLLIFIGLTSITSYAQTNLETLIEGADFGDMVVVSGKGDVVIEYTRVDSLSKKAQDDDQSILSKLTPEQEAVIRNQLNINLSFTFTGPKIRCDENTMNLLPTGRWYTQNWHWAYNGEKMDLLRLDGLGENGLIVPLGSVRTENVIPVERYNPRYNGMQIMGTPVGSFLRGSLGSKTVEDLEIIGEEIQDGIPCTIVSGHIVDTDETIIVWLAPGIMYRPKHIEIRSSDASTIVHNTFREHSGGIWFPEYMVKEEFYIDSKSGEEVLYKRDTLAVQDNYELNIELPDSMFEVEFPVGMMVYDFRIGERFEVK